MQVWEQVKVTDEQSEYHGQAGVVTQVKGDQVTVKLDVGGDQEFTESQLQRLG